METITLKNGNTAFVKKSNCYHYYIALAWNNNRVGSWHRVNKKQLNAMRKAV